jgi:hypothetical protein
MLQRSLTTPTATEIAGSLQQTLERSALRSLQNTLQLPETWQQYLIMLGVVLLIGAGITTHMLITVQIAEAQSTVRALRAEYEWIQFQNSALIHEIATRTSLSEMQSRAAELGYIPATSRTFVYRSAAPALGPAATITTLPDADAPTVIVQPGPPTPAAVPPGYGSSDGSATILARSCPDMAGAASHRSRRDGDGAKGVTWQPR